MSDESFRRSDLPQGSDELKAIDVPFEESDRALMPGTSLSRRRDPYEEIAVKTSDTANRIIQVIIWGFVLSFPFLIISLFAFQWLLQPEPGSDQSAGVDAVGFLTQFFEKWLAVMTVLAGGAFGYYFGIGGRSKRE